MCFLVYRWYFILFLYISYLFKDISMELLSFVYDYGGLDVVGVIRRNGKDYNKMYVI